MSRTYKVIWTDVAERDLESVIDYLADDHPQNAVRVLDRIIKKAHSLKRNPKRGRKIPEFAEFHDSSFRELLIPPWRLIYRIMEKRVDVLAFLDGRRDLAELMYERLIRLK